MPTRSKTLRRLPPTTRKLVRLTDELQSVLTRLKNFRPVIQDLEMSARAEVARELHQEPQPGDLCKSCIRGRDMSSSCTHDAAQFCGGYSPIQQTPLFQPDTSISTVSTGEGRMS